jgi:PST family polysaccharide transporter
MKSELTRSFRKRILNGVLWSFASNWSAKLLDFVAMLVLARLLSPEDFGLVALVTVYIALGSVFVEGGFSQAIIQREDIDDLHLDTAFWISIAIGVFLALGTFFVGPIIFERLFDDERLGAVVEVTSVLFIVAGLQSVQHAQLTRRLQFKQLAIRRAISSVAGSSTAIVLAIKGFGIWSLVAGNMVKSSVSVLLLWIASDWRPHRRFSMRCFYDLYAFGIYVVGRNLIGFMGHRGINFLIGVFLGATALGYYVLASRMIRSVSDLITAAVQSVAFPAFSRIQSNQRKLIGAFYQAVRYTSVVCMPIYAGIIVTAELLVTLLLGAKWASAIPVMQVLCISGIVDSVVSRYAHVMILARGRANWALYMSVASTIGVYAAMLIVVDRGIVAVAFATVIVAYLFAPVYLVVAHRLVKFPIGGYLRQFYPALVASVVMSGSVVLADWTLLAGIQALWKLLLIVLGGGITYLATVLLLDRTLLADVVSLASEIGLGPHGQAPKEKR